MDDSLHKVVEMTCWKAVLVSRQITLINKYIWWLRRGGRQKAHQNGDYIETDTIQTSNATKSTEIQENVFELSNE